MKNHTLKHSKGGFRVKCTKCGKVKKRSGVHVEKVLSGLCRSCWLKTLDLECKGVTK